MSNRFKRKRRERASTSDTQPQRPVVPPPPDFHAIRAEYAAKAVSTAQFGVRNPAAETVVQLCDYILGRASAHQPDYAWLDQHRELVLKAWGAVPASVKGFTGSSLWIVPDPGAREVTRLCPACGNQREKRRHCDNCERTGVVRVTLEGTP